MSAQILPAKTGEKGEIKGERGGREEEEEEEEEEQEASLVTRET